MTKTQTNFLFACTLMLAFFYAGESNARADTINFNDVPGTSNPQPIAGNRYQSQGVLLSSVGGAGLYVVAPSYPTNTPPNVLYASTDPDGLLADSLLIIDFVGPGTSLPGVTNMVSFFVSDFSDVDEMIDLWTAAIFDVNGNLLDSRTGNASNALVSFSRAFADISRLTFRPSFDQETIATLNFNTPAAIPEPTTMLLLGTGLAGLAARARKGRKAPSNEKA